MKEIVEKISSILDTAGINHNMLEPNNTTDPPEIVFTLKHDDGCSKDIVIMIEIDDSLMLLKGFLDDYEIPKAKIPDAVLFCNTWNATHYMPQVYVIEEGNVGISWCNTIWNELPDEYIKDAMILTFARTAWQFFSEFLKKFLD
ncbi:MAG: YbjN domain-containing protein [Treponemataceae bacterium]|nr:YbjN domain-containing protein [Treponemataceae bacterium]